jgi:hypothetical protein
MLGTHRIRKELSRVDRVATLACAALFVGGFGSLCNCGDVQDTRSARSTSHQQIVKDTRKPRPWITIGKETTYVTRPAGNDGYIDYLAALNEAASAGVTVDNNAGVLLVRAIDLSPLKGRTRTASSRCSGSSLLRPPKGASRSLPNAKWS